MHDGTISWAQLLDDTAAQHGRVHARWLCEEASGTWGDDFTDILREPVTERSMAHSSLAPRPNWLPSAPSR
jgi:hypothetical protein